KEMVEVLKPFEEVTRHICGAKYPTMNLIYSYIRMLKNKYAPVAEKGESVESWLDFIYRSLSEDSDQIADSDTSVSSDDKADIPSAGNRKQWQYAHVRRSVYRQNSGLRYLPSTNCNGLLKRMHTAIYLSLNELWEVSHEIGLKASLLDPRMLKFLSFATLNEKKNVEDQIHAELFALKPNNNESNTERTQATVEDCDSLSAELWGSHLMPDLPTATEDELTRYLREQ
ncbi:20762_t:CDS:2, partial [Dentiscutata erythropus]